jgi:hypothetical protein
VLRTLRCSQSVNFAFDPEPVLQFMPRSEGAFLRQRVRSAANHFLAGLSIHVVTDCGGGSGFTIYGGVDHAYF